MRGKMESFPIVNCFLGLADSESLPINPLTTAD